MKNQSFPSCFLTFSLCARVGPRSEPFFLPGVFHPHNPPLFFHLCRLAIPPMAFQSAPNRLYITIPPPIPQLPPSSFSGSCLCFSKSPLSPYRFFYPPRAPSNKILDGISTFFSFGLAYVFLLSLFPP